MSVKIKIAIGFFVILLMVFFQTYFIVSINVKRDNMFQNSLSLFNLNSIMKDRVVELLTLECDISNTIVNRKPVIDGTHADVRNTYSCVYLIKSLNEWCDAFIISQRYKDLDEKGKDDILQIKPRLIKIANAINAIRSINEYNVSERMRIFESDIRIPVSETRNIAEDFAYKNGRLFGMSYYSMLEYSAKMKYYQTMTIVFGFLLLVFIIFYMQYILVPLDWVTEGIKRVAGGDLSFKVKKRSNDEIGRLAESFNQMTIERRFHRDNMDGLIVLRTRELVEAKELLVQSNVELENSNRAIEEIRGLIKKQVKLAAHVQSSFLPKKSPKSNEWDGAIVYCPMSSVSGDMYDFYLDQKDQFSGSVLMDVSGHGVASGLITMLAKSLMYRKFVQNMDLDLSRVMELINDDLVTELGGVDRYYLSGIMLRFRGNKVEYVNAGHPDLLIKSEGVADAHVVADEKNPDYKGFFLGFANMKIPYSQIEFHVKKGDTMLFFTDGISESKDRNGELLGLQGVIRLFNEAPQENLNDTLNYMVDKLYEITGTKELDDDMTIIALRRTV